MSNWLYSVKYWRRAFLWTKEIEAEKITPVASILYKLRHYVYYRYWLNRIAHIIISSFWRSWAKLVLDRHWHLDLRSAFGPVSSKSADIYSHYFIEVYIFQIGVQLLLDFSDLVDVLCWHMHNSEMAWKHREFLHIRRLSQKPTGLRWLYYEFERAVSKGSQTNFQRNVGTNMARNFVELLAEFHHVYAEGT